MGRRRRRRSSWGTPKWAIGLVAVVAIVTIWVVALALEPRGLTPEQAQAANEEFAQRQADRDAKRAAAEKAAWDAQTVQVARPEGRPLTLAMYGDSITFGWDAGSDATTYREIVRSTLAAGGAVDATIQARPGATIRQIHDESKIVRDADVTVVALGLNDLWTGNTPEAATQDYVALLADIRAQAPNTGLVCLGLFTDSRAGVASQIDTALSAACEDAGGKFVPLWSINLQPGTHDKGLPSAFEDGESDGGHPTDKGMAAIAYRLLERLPLLAGSLVAPEGFAPSDPSLRP